MMAWERDRRLKEKLNYLQELEKVKNFDWDDWRKRFLKHHNNKKSRVTDLFRKLDEDADGKAWFVYIYQLFVYIYLFMFRFLVPGWLYWWHPKEQIP